MALQSKVQNGILKLPEQQKIPEGNKIPKKGKSLHALFYIVSTLLPQKSCFYCYNVAIIKTYFHQQQSPNQL